MSRRVYALLGRKDAPTDAVEEYCRYLGAALEAHDIELRISRVSWEIHGWRKALHELKLQAADWRDAWVLVQYTALSWSRRGFPPRVLQTIRILKSAGARVVMVYHDVEPYSGFRLVDVLRRSIQTRTMNRALSLAALAIFTVPLANISWLPSSVTDACFIPVGPNFIIPPMCFTDIPVSKIATIGVFSISGGAAGDQETKNIVSSVGYAAEHLGRLRLVVFGRHAEIRERELLEGFKNLPVELSIDGVIPPDEIFQKLFACDLLLFVRGAISSRRSSAIAGIACGLPVIAFEGSETSRPITEAGVVLASETNPNELSEALLRVLSDDSYRVALVARSRTAYQTYFSWPSIASRFAELIHAR
jgi:glycosyltransferase involved in cell wall biosynthesis